MTTETVTLHRSDWQRIADHCGHQSHKHGAPKQIVALCAAVQLAITLLLDEDQSNEFPWLTRPVEKWQTIVQMLTVDWTKREHASVYWAAWRIGEQIGLSVPQRGTQEAEASLSLAGLAFPGFNRSNGNGAKQDAVLRDVKLPADAALDLGSHHE